MSPDLDVLLRRVEELERQNRTWRRPGALLLLAALSLALFAAGRCWRDGKHLRTQTVEAQVLRANCLFIEGTADMDWGWLARAYPRDWRGAVLFANKEQAALQLSNEKGEVSAVLRVGRGEVSTITTARSFADTASLDLKGYDGTVEVNLEAYPGFGKGVGMRPSAQFVMKDLSGRHWRPRVWLNLGETGTPEFKLYDDNWKAFFSKP
jgi:hypothetical protein